MPNFQKTRRDACLFAFGCTSTRRNVADAQSAAGHIRCAIMPMVKVPGVAWTSVWFLSISCVMSPCQLPQTRRCHGSSAMGETWLALYDRLCLFCSMNAQRRTEQREDRGTEQHDQVANPNSLRIPRHRHNDRADYAILFADRHSVARKRQKDSVK